VKKLISIEASFFILFYLFILCESSNFTFMLKDEESQCAIYLYYWRFWDRSWCKIVV